MCKLYLANKLTAILCLKAVLLMFCFAIVSCELRERKTAAEPGNKEVTKPPTKQIKSIYTDLIEFSRTASFEKLQNKIQQNIPLIIHAKIPLCDNDNQGIVKVPKSLGNGQDLRNNLYWGAKYGIKNHFIRSAGWKQLSSKKEYNNEILERVILSKIFNSRTEVFLVLDAYRGDQMKKCLEDFLGALAGRNHDVLEYQETTFKIGSDADLNIFNGHNGLMDVNIDPIQSTDNLQRETGIIGCLSYKYFKEHLLVSKGYPILTTNNLMAPEGYVMEALINAWVDLKKEGDIRNDVGAAYHKYQKCGLKGATRLFKSGW